MSKERKSLKKPKTSGHKEKETKESWAEEKKRDKSSGPKKGIQHRLLRDET